MTDARSPQGSFQDLYERFYNRVVSFFFHSFRIPRDEAQDLAQDVFVRVYQGWSRYRGDSEWNFIETTARRVAFNRFRAQRAEKRQAVTVSPEDVPETALVQAQQETDFESTQRAAHLRVGISRLSPTLRVCVLLQLQGFKYHEIAAILRITIDAVKSRLRDARTELREYLGEEPEGFDSTEERREDDR